MRCRGYPFIFLMNAVLHLALIPTLYQPTSEKG